MKCGLGIGEAALKDGKMGSFGNGGIWVHSDENVDSESPRRFLGGLGAGSIGFVRHGKSGYQGKNRQRPGGWTGGDGEDIESRRNIG
jgi:hypothetical protein